MKPKQFVESLASAQWNIARADMHWQNFESVRFDPLDAGIQYLLARECARVARLHLNDAEAALKPVRRAQGRKGGLPAEAPRRGAKEGAS